MRLTFIITSILFLMVSTAKGQDQFSSENFSLSIGLNAIDNTGNQNPLSLFTESEHIAFSRPIEVFLNYQYNYRFEFYLGATFNKFNKDQIVDGTPIADNLNYRSIDAGARYFFYTTKTGKNGELKPYAHAGLGIHDIVGNQFMINTGLGLQYHISPSVGIYANSVAKFSFDNALARSNHFQYSIGVILKPFGNCSTCGMY